MVFALGGAEVVVALELSKESSGCGTSDMNELSHLARITSRDKNSIMGRLRAVREYGQMDGPAHYAF